MGVNPDEDQHWTKYSIHLLVFSAVSLAFTYAILRLQAYLPLNPAGQGVVSPHLCFQYGDELHDQYQLAVLRWRKHHELFLADGGARDSQFLLSRRRDRGCGGLDPRPCAKTIKGIGNFWADLVRC